MNTQQAPWGSYRKPIIFVFLTFAASWLIAAVYYALGGRLDNPIATVVLLVYMFMPMTIINGGIFVFERSRGGAGIAAPDHSGD